MKTLISYYSLTGNTEKIAKSIYDEIEGEKSLLELSEVPGTTDYDLVFVGFPIYNFEPVKQAQEFIRKLEPGKKVVLFTTMSLKAAPEDGQTQYLYNLTISNCRECALHTDLLGIFDCPGELSEQAANALLKSGDTMLQMFGAMRTVTLGFPTKQNILQARQFVKNLMFKFKFNDSAQPLAG